MTDSFEPDLDPGVPAPVDAFAEFSTPAPAPARPAAPAPVDDARQPPAALEAEAAVLGACLLGNTETVDKVLFKLNGPDFYRGAHARIFEAIKALREAELVVDLVAVVNKLDAAGHLAFVGGPVAVSALTDHVGSISNVEAYAQIVFEKAQLRRLITAAAEITNAAFQNQDDLSGVLDQAGELILNVAEGRALDFEGVGQNWGEHYQQLVVASQGKKPFGFSSGLKEWDRIVGGIIPGKIYVIGGRPGAGKSALALNIATDLANSGTPCAFFSMEMEKETMRNRLVSAKCEIDGKVIEQGRMNERELAAYHATMTAAGRWPLWLYYDPQLRLQRLLSLMRIAVSKMRSKVFFLDYIQMLRDDSTRHPSLAQETTAICRRLFQFAHTHKVAIVECAQLNRDVKDREPRISDLKESGGIEECADVIAMIHEETDANDKGKPVVSRKLIFGKNRAGETGQVELLFARRFTKFQDFFA